MGMKMSRNQNEGITDSARTGFEKLTGYANLSVIDMTYYRYPNVGLLLLYRKNVPNKISN